MQQSLSNEQYTRLINAAKIELDNQWNGNAHYIMQHLSRRILCRGASSATQPASNTVIYTIHGLFDSDTGLHSIVQPLQECYPDVPVRHIMQRKDPRLNTTIAQFAAQVRAQIAKQGDEAKQIILIGHSRGTLVGQELVASAKHYGLNIGLLIMLSSPSYGAPRAKLATPVLGQESALVHMDPSSDISKARLLRFNQAVSAMRLPYFSIMGSRDNIVPWFRGYPFSPDLFIKQTQALQSLMNPPPPASFFLSRWWQSYKFRQLVAATKRQALQSLLHQRRPANFFVVNGGSHSGLLGHPNTAALLVKIVATYLQRQAPTRDTKPETKPLPTGPLYQISIASPNLDAQILQHYQTDLSPTPNTSLHRAITRISGHPTLRCTLLNKLRQTDSALYTRLLDLPPRQLDHAIVKLCQHCAAIKQLVAEISQTRLEQKPNCNAPSKLNV